MFVYMPYVFHILYPWHRKSHLQQASDKWWYTGCRWQRFGKHDMGSESCRQHPVGPLRVLSRFLICHQTPEGVFPTLLSKCFKPSARQSLFTRCSTIKTNFAANPDYTVSPWHHCKNLLFTNVWRQEYDAVRCQKREPCVSFARYISYVTVLTAHGFD